MRDSPTSRRMALQALLALGGLSCSRTLFAEPNNAARVPGTPEDLSGALADPEGGQTVPDIVRRETAGEGRREHLTREPALGLPGDTLPHQLKGDHDRGLLDAEPLEVAQLT